MSCVDPPTWPPRRAKARLRSHPGLDTRRRDHGADVGSALVGWPLCHTTSRSEGSLVKSRDKVSVAILGTGMAGCGAIHRLSGESLKPAVFDKATYFGGHTASFSHDGGYTFDEGGHVSFTKNERLKELFARNVKDEFEVVHANIN